MKGHGDRAGVTHGDWRGGVAGHEDQHSHLVGSGRERDVTLEDARPSRGSCDASHRVILVGRLDYRVELGLRRTREARGHLQGVTAGKYRRPAASEGIAGWRRLT